jgi:diaminopimelate epimerase
VRYRFSKYEGLGNDFLVVTQDQFAALSVELAQRLCDRHFGVGGDGVLVTGLCEGRPFMQVFNADGSTPEMCGNGLRCVALYLLDQGLLHETSFDVATGAGPHHVTVVRAEAGATVEVQMRAASLDAGDVFREGLGERKIEERFEVDGHTLHVTAVSMGNPHLVLFEEGLAEAARLGPRIERDVRLKAGANVGFAHVRDASNLELTVWERGVGFTLACGTGACAAAVAAVETGRAARNAPLTVHLPGGPLQIVVPEPGAPISMRGPARLVFEGVVELPDKV